MAFVNGISECSHFNNKKSFIFLLVILLYFTILFFAIIIIMAIEVRKRYEKDFLLTYLALPDD